MYKKQLKIQKIFCLSAIIVSAAVFIYSLGIITTLYDCLYSTMRNSNDRTKTDVPGSIVYYDMQEFNQIFLKASIGLIILAVLLFITNTHTRRRYYVSNYITTGLFSAAALYMSWWSHAWIEYYKDEWLQVDFEALKEHAEMWETAYSESTFWADIHYLISGLLILTALGLIFNMIWKIRLMKDEKDLITTGKETVQ